MSTGHSIRKRFPDRVPVVLRKHKQKTKEKFLAPENMSMREFNSVIRCRMHLPSEQALFIFIRSNTGSMLPAPHETLILYYEAYKQADGCLHMEYTGENTFGSGICR